MYPHVQKHLQQLSQVVDPLSRISVLKRIGNSSNLWESQLIRIWKVANYLVWYNFPYKEIQIKTNEQVNTYHSWPTAEDHKQSQERKIPAISWAKAKVMIFDDKIYSSDNYDQFSYKIFFEALLIFSISFSDSFFFSSLCVDSVFALMFLFNFFPKLVFSGISITSPRTFFLHWELLQINFVE